MLRGLQPLLHSPNLCNVHAPRYVAALCIHVPAYRPPPQLRAKKPSGLANHDGQFWCRPLFKSRTCLELRWWVVVGLYDTARNFSAQFQGEGEGEEKFMENERRLNIHFFGQLGNWTSSSKAG